MWILRNLPGWWPVATQILDLAAFLVFMYFTAGYSSHFFVYFTFWLVCATLRWQWRGAVWSGAVAITVFMVMSFYASGISENPAFDLNQFIVRGAQSIVVTALLSYLGVLPGEVERREVPSGGLGAEGSRGASNSRARTARARGGRSSVASDAHDLGNIRESRDSASRVFRTAFSIGPTKGSMPSDRSSPSLWRARTSSV